MLRSKFAEQMVPGDRVALPFKKAATVKQTWVGRQFVTVEWEEPYQKSRYEIGQEVLLEGDDDA